MSCCSWGCVSRLPGDGDYSGFGIPYYLSGTRKYYEFRHFGRDPESSSNQQLHALYPALDAGSRRYGVYTVGSPDVSAYPLAYPGIGISH